MDNMNRQTETRNISVEKNTLKNIIGILFGALEIILGLRLLFKLLGANPDNVFIKAIYAFTHYFVLAFENIFAEVTVNQDAGAVFEPATVIAMVVVALIAWWKFSSKLPQ